MTSCFLPLECFNNCTAGQRYVCTLLLLIYLQLYLFLGVYGPPILLPPSGLPVFPWKSLTLLPGVTDSWSSALYLGQVN